MKCLKLLGAILPVSFALAASASAQGMVTGRVSDARTNGPLSGVTVADSRGVATVTTDSAGQFSLACKGAMTLNFSKYGYAPQSVSIESCSAEVVMQLVPTPPSLSAVNVTGTPATVNLRQPRATTTLTPQELDRGTGLFLQDAINLTPGIRMEKRTMGGGQRIIIRGYSNDRDAGNFTGTGYKAYLNGIPLTDAEGKTMLDDIDFANLGRVDVIRGPASTIYGGGIGGVVNLYTAGPDMMGTSVAQNTTVGSDGLLRSDTKLQHASERATTVLDYGHQTYDSYRVHSASKKDFGTFLGEFKPTDQESISTYLSYSNSRDLRAGELDSATFARKQNTGESKYIKNNARSFVEGFRGGVTHNYQFDSHIQNASTVFFSNNNDEDVYAAGLNYTSNQNFGARTVFNTDFTAGTLPLRGMSGGELTKSNVSAQGYGMTNSVLGPLRSDIETHSMQYSIFSQWDLLLPEQFTLTAGASANFIEYQIVDRFANTGNPTHLDGSGRKTFDPVITPRIALNKMFGDNFSIYVDVSQGYSPPTSSDAIISYTGEPNTGLKPERATQYEIGTKGNLQNGRLMYQVSLFDMRITNKLSSQGVFDTDNTVLYSYTVNAGDQRDRGVEVAASYALVQDQTQILSLLRPFATYTYSDFTYRNFKSNNNNAVTTVDYSGKNVVGVAPHVFNVGADAELRSGFYGNVTYHHTDQEPISYDNAHKAVAFSLLDAKIGYRHDIANRFKLDAFFGGQNLTNSLYFTQVFLNHKFDSPTPPNMYLPGPYSAKFFGGLKLSYQL